MSESLEKSTLREVWADQVEAALGVCQLGERVPDVQSYFEHDLQVIRTRIENEVTALHNNEPLCDRVSDITTWSRSQRVVNKFEFWFEAKAHHK